MASPEQVADPRRWFVGIGVGEYDDDSLALARAVGDVGRMADWFERCGVTHERALQDLADNPGWAAITTGLAEFFEARSSDDVVVVYIACHGELEGDVAYLFGRDTPPRGLAGRAVVASQLGSIVGQSRPHNVLLIVDACVAGAIAEAIEDGTRRAVRAENSRQPDRRFAQVMVASAFGLAPARDGQFAEAFLRTVGQERWTGTTSSWVTTDQLTQGLNEELRELAPGQVASVTLWANAPVELIPNPNVATRQLGGLTSDEEFAAHFDPASRGVPRGEAGSFFTGRHDELRRVVAWLDEPHAEAPEAGDGRRGAVLVVTGSPGAGKSALLSRVAVLADPARRPGDAVLAAQPEGTVPRVGSLDRVLWCHNKTARQVVGELAGALGGTATSVGGLLALGSARRATIAIDALDEAAGGDATTIARDVLAPLAAQGRVRLLVATRRRAVHGDDEGLLDDLGARPDDVLDLDLAPARHGDMHQYVRSRLQALGPGGAPDDHEADEPADEATDRLAQRIVEAAGDSFLVASIAARVAPMADPGEFRLPAEVGEALAGYLDRLPDPEGVRDVLRPLAWALGPGLPWGTVWPAVASALSSRPPAPGGQPPVDDAAIASVLTSAADVVVESTDGGEPVYRLFHEALAEHLRSTTGHGMQAPAAVADALRALAADAPWHRVPRYVRSYLPACLGLAGRVDELVEVLLDPAWERQRRADAGDPFAAMDDVQEATRLLLEHDPDPLSLVPLCHQYSRAMTTAAPLLLDVLARSGQVARARVMAANLTDASDRMLAFRLLAAVHATEGDHAAAGACVDEVERSLPAVHPSHHPMGWWSVARAAVAAGLPERAGEAADRAAAAALAIGGDGWDLANGLFWAARAARTVGSDAGLARVREALEADRDRLVAFRNQTLQAAAVSGHTDLLREHMVALRAGSRYPLWPVRDGNLALALADAGMDDDLGELVDLVGDGPPAGEPDANKRWAWALALSGRMAQAVAALDHVGDPIETGKAITRLAHVALAAEDQATLEVLAARAEALLPGDEPRARARLVRVLWYAGRHADALAQAEAAITAGQDPGPIVDPRAGGEPPERDPSGAPAGKTARRAMVTSRAPMPDEQAGLDVAVMADRGEVAAARARLADVGVPLFRARALAALARAEGGEAGLATWLEALTWARQAGRGVVEELLAVGDALLRAAGRGALADALTTRVQDVDARWELESFAEQYAAMRATMPSGGDRTRRMTSLMLLPRHLAASRGWRPEEVREAWARGEEGTRLFALGLMQGDAGLVVPEVLVEGIRRSRSAFEQYHALGAAELADPDRPGMAAVRAAAEAELDEVVRDDGSPARLGGDSGRLRLARRVAGRD